MIDKSQSFGFPLLEIREEELAKAPPLFIMAAYWYPLVHPAYGGFS